MSESVCQHFDNLKAVTEPQSKVCRQCVEIGDTWVHLRACLECGTVGCCDNSKNRHARKHWEAHSHPLIQSIEPGETWQYCFEDGVIVR
jgi:uncharacterized UBP type Zn finger protein